MSLLAGTRVIRGPDWMWGDQDGGDGHLGTITDVVIPDSNDISPSTVRVTWDIGKKGNYRAGFEGKFDLRMFDNAPAGVSHKGVRCGACNANPVVGVSWTCTQCLNYNLCTVCYMGKSHETDHTFMRRDEPHDTGVSVGTRKDVMTMTPRGLFPGAMVKRGPDWPSEKKDGGRNKFGTVQDICDWSESSQRSGVLVLWNTGETLKYQVGHDGKVVVRATDAAEGEPIYQSHLPKIGERNACLRGERVIVDMDTSTMNQYQQDFGAKWAQSLREKLGEIGEVERMDQRGWLMIRYGDGVTWTVPSFVVTKETINTDNLTCAAADIPEPRQGENIITEDNLNLVDDCIRNSNRAWDGNVQEGDHDEEDDVITLADKGHIRVEVTRRKKRIHLRDLMSQGGNDGDDDLRKSSQKTKSLGLDDFLKDSSLGNETDMIRLLAQLAKQGKVKIRHRGGGTDERLIIHAAANGELQTMKDLVRQNPKLVNAKPHNQTPLQIASHEGYQSIVEFLVGANASLEEEDGDGDTALVFAVLGGNLEIVKYLLEKGAYPNAIDKRRITPLHICAMKGRRALAEILLKHGASVNMQDKDGDLPIHLAIRGHSSELLQLLINHPTADLRLRNSRGFPPLHHAVRRNCQKAVELIIARDSSLCNIKKNDGFTPLHLAAYNDYSDLTRLLLQKTDPTFVVADQPGTMTPLHLATLEGYSTIIEILVEHGVQINAYDKDGDTPLHLAVQRRRNGKQFRSTPTLEKINLELNDPSIVAPGDIILAYLIRNGSDITLKNKSGETALDALRDPGLRRSLLKLAGVNVSINPAIFGESKPHQKPEGRGQVQERRLSNESVPNVLQSKEKVAGAPEGRSGGVDMFDGVHRIDPLELKLGKTVGRGGFGEVKKATWRGTEVAVKIIPTPVSKDSQVEMEVAIHKQARHPNIVALMAVGHRVGQTLIVMEFIDGNDLFNIIFRKMIPLTPAIKMDIAVHLLSALTFLHASKILHLDIKPGNVMIDRASKRALLCDLGLAHIKKRSSMALSTSDRGPRGTITHMPPEMMRKDDRPWAGPGNDVWSIACTFLELFVEKHLWPEMEFLALIKTLCKPGVAPPILHKASPEIRNLLEPCFNGDPLKRPSAHALLGQFQELQRNSQTRH